MSAPSGDHIGPAFGAGFGDERPNGRGGHIHDRDVGVRKGVHLRRGGVVEGDLAAIGRPLEGADREAIAPGQAAGPVPSRTSFTHRCDMRKSASSTA